MTISKTQNGSQLVVALDGRLDILTAPELEEELKSSIDGVTDLVLDFTNLEYISSAGLRVLLSAHKIMHNQGKMTVKNINSIVAEVFEVTGFSSILNIE